MDEAAKKGLVVLGAALATALVIKKVMAAPPEPPPDDSPQIQIKVYDRYGNEVPHRSPLSLEEGGEYTIVVTITNNAKKRDQLWEATYSIYLEAATTLETLNVTTSPNVYFGPGETRELSYLIKPTLGLAPTTGQIYVAVTAPTGAQVGDAAAAVDIVVVPIDYGVIIDIGDGDGGIITTQIAFKMINWGGVEFYNWIVNIMGIATSGWGPTSDTKVFAWEWPQAAYDVGFQVGVGTGNDLADLGIVRLQLAGGRLYTFNAITRQITVSEWTG